MDLPTLRLFPLVLQDEDLSGITDKLSLIVCNTTVHDLINSAIAVMRRPSSPERDFIVKTAFSKIGSTVPQDYRPSNDYPGKKLSDRDEWVWDLARFLVASAPTERGFEKTLDRIKADRDLLTDVYIELGNMGYHDNVPIAWVNPIRYLQSNNVFKGKQIKLPDGDDAIQWMTIREYGPPFIRAWMASVEAKDPYFSQALKIQFAFAGNKINRTKDVAKAIQKQQVKAENTSESADN